MYIRQSKIKRKNSNKTFFQFSLAQTYRADGKVKQRNILYIGSSDLLIDKNNRAIVLEILKSKIFRTEGLFPINPPKELKELADSLFEKYLIKYGQEELSDKIVSIPPAPKKAEYHNVDIKGLEVREVKTFGIEYLSSQILKKLSLKEILLSVKFTEKQANKALLAIASRAIFSSSEYKTAQYLEMSSDLKNHFQIENKISHKQLYSITDKLYENKDKIDNLLHERITNLFDLEDKLVIFDISNSYFETRKANSRIAKYGRSKEKRTDCPLVVFTGVINAEGFIRHSKIYEGNKADSTTLDDMIADLENYSSKKAKKTIVIDAGIATEKNLETIHKKGYKYVCVSRKRIKEYETTDKRTITKLTDRGKNKVELSVFKPKGFTDTWMQVESQAKRKKENSMNEKLKQRFEEDLSIIQKALKTKGGTKKSNKVWERIGRAKQKNNRVSSNYQIKVKEEDGIATDLSWTIKMTKEKKDKTKGIYFIRTNYTNPKEEELWTIYNTIREVESTFRCLKSDLNIRPIHHQKDKRIEAHIYLTILAYQLVNTVRHMLKEKGIKHSWTNIVRIMNTQTIQTIILPIDKKNIHLNIASIPIKEVKEIYKATNCKQTKPAQKKYVVYH